jgi:hypothetical protein
MCDFRNSSRSLEIIYRRVLPLLINACYHATYGAITCLTAASARDTINLTAANRSTITQEVDTIDLQP